MSIFPLVPINHVSVPAGPDGQHHHRARLHELPAGAGGRAQGPRPHRGRGAGGGAARSHAVSPGQVQTCIYVLLYTKYFLIVWQADQAARLEVQVR